MARILTLLFGHWLTLVCTGYYNSRMLIRRVLLLLIAITILPLWLKHTARAEQYSTIENRGATAIRLSGRRQDGVTSSFTLAAGEKQPFTGTLIEVRHVPSNLRHTEIVDISIVEPNGRKAKITTPSGNYVFETGHIIPDPEDNSHIKRQGSATNQSNVSLYLSLARRGQFSPNKVELLPGQSASFSKEIIALSIDGSNGLRGDERIQVLVTMPDGSQHNLNAAGDIARVNA